MTLNELKAGESAEVIQINLNGNIRRRLQELGLINGTLVKCVLIAKHGDPIAYRIRGALIALRNRDTKNIIIEPKEADYGVNKQFNGQ